MDISNCNKLGRLNFLSGKHRQCGITLIEIMISLVIGLIIVGGVWTLLVNSRTSFDTSQNQAHMLDSARYALHVIGRDLRHSGSYGPLTSSTPQLISGQAGLGTAAEDCGNQFFIDINRRVFGTNGTNPFGGTCLKAAKNYLPGTDILVVRYADPSPVSNENAELPASTNTVFIHSYHSRGQLFLASGSGSAPTLGKLDATGKIDQFHMLDGSAPIDIMNYRVVANVYYISSQTNPGDAIPSLRRISLVPGGTGPEMRDELLVSGVQDLQVQFGINDCTANVATCPTTVNRYVDADNNAVFGGATWPNPQVTNQIRSVRVWLLVRSETTEVGLNTAQTFTLGSTSVTAANDGFLRTVYSGVFNLRNTGG